MIDRIPRPCFPCVAGGEYEVGAVDSLYALLVLFGNNSRNPDIIWITVFSRKREELGTLGYHHLLCFE